ncbi:MAG: cell wall metabolism sensor histidine kinase WalK, partial [Candidatus Eisenbacteria bacterium]
MRLRPPVSDFSIRTKVILMVAGTLVLAVLFTAYLVRQLVSQNILNQKLTTVEILTTSILHDITYYSDRDSEEAGQQIIAKYMTYYRIITHMAIYNRRFVCIATSDVHRTHQKTRDPEILGAVVEARPSLHVSRADRQGLGIRSIARAVTVYVSLQDVQQTLAALDRRIALIMAAQLALVSTALFVLLRGSILLRLRRLMTVTQQITQGNYGLEVGDRQGDEIGQLGRAFDRMTADLQRSKLEIEGYNKRLEQRLREATAELQKAYEELKNAQSQLVLNEKM